MEAIVIGSGVIGLSIAYELEKAGHEVLRIDDDNQQASAGEARIFRVFHEDPRLEEEAKRASRLWCEWEDELGVSLIKRNGLWLHGGWSKRAGYREFLKRYPLSEEPLIYAIDPDGGVGLIGRTIKTLQENIKGERYEGEVVDVGEGVVWMRSGEVFQADYIFVAAGYNTRKLMGRPRGRVMHHVRFLFPFRDSDFPGSDLPALIDKDLYLYGVAEEKGFALGLGRDEELGFVHPKNHEEERRKRRFIQSNKEGAKQIVGNYFPELLEEPTNYIYCLRDEKDSDGYEIERSEKVFGISGNNLFKFAPLLARIALEEVLKT